MEGRYGLRGTDRSRVILPQLCESNEQTNQFFSSIGTLMETADSRLPLSPIM